MGIKIMDFPGGAWVALPEGLEERIVKEKIANSDVCVSDLDHTDARSPAELSAWLDLMSPLAFDYWFWGWAAKAGMGLLRDLA
ncbi:MAG: hypothetical protein V1740_04010, partial [Candidatus Woesearchaeota archaeon]